MSEIISNTECYTIISNYLKITKNDIFINDYEVKQKIGEVVGFMGEYYGLKIRYSILNNETAERLTKTEIFFVKLIPLTNPYHKKEIEEKGFFEKEIGIYTNILTELEKYCDEKCFARCVYSRPDMIVLEDLTKKNYCNLKVGESYTKDHYKTVLKSQASLHVSSIVYEEKTGNNIGKKFEKYLKEIQVNIKNSWYAAGLEGIKAVAKIHPKYQTSEYQNFFDTKLVDYLIGTEYRVNISSKFRNVLCHRDSWDKNILFKYNKNGLPVGCTFVDFQLTRYTPPAIDVLFFIYMNTNTKEREEILEEHLTYYFEILNDKMIKNNISEENRISLQEFQKSCEEIKIIILILCALCFPLTWLPEGWVDEIKRKDQEKYSYYMTVNRNEMLINLINEYEYYRNIIFEVHEELIDYIWREFNREKQ